MLNLKNICASCMHLSSVGSGALPSFIAYNSGFKCLDIFKFYLALDSTFTPLTYLKSNSITIMRIYK